jgi:hypothetical protein
MRGQSLLSMKTDTAAPSAVTPFAEKNENNFDREQKLGTLVLLA